MGNDIINRKIKIINETYTNARITPEMVGNFPLLHEFISTGAVRPDWSELYKTSKIESKGVTFETFLKMVVQDDVIATIEIIEALFDIIKSEIRPNKPQKKLWLQLSYKWPRIETQINQSSPTSHLKYYIICHKVLGIDNSIAKEFGAALKSEIQACLLAYIKYISPSISQYRLYHDTDIEKSTIRRLKPKTDLILKRLKNPCISPNKEWIEYQIERLKGQLASLS